MLNIDLKNKIALVTGVSSGLGQGIAKMLAKSGAIVIGCSRSEKDKPGVQQFLKNSELEGVEAHYFQVDISIENQIENWVHQAYALHNRLDILVSNAGINVFKGAKDCSIDDYNFNHDVNLKSHWLLSKFSYPYLAKNNGVILLMTSNHAYTTIEGCFPYNMTKTAITGLVRSLAIEWGPKIRVVGIAPGFIDTAGNDTWFNSFEDPLAERKRTENLHPVKQIGDVDDVGALCAFLCSDYSKFITGTTYLIDGGRSAIMQDL